MQYQESKLGKNAADPPSTRLPVIIYQYIIKTKRTNLKTY